MKKYQISVAVILIIIGVGYLIFAASEAEGITYKTSEEIRDLEKKKVPISPSGVYKLLGHVKTGTIEKSPDGKSVTFLLRDEKDGEMKSQYAGIVPDMLKDECEVVMTGTYDRQKDIFVATELLTKCPSRYEGKYQSETDSAAMPPHGSDGPGAPDSAAAGAPTAASTIPDTTGNL